MYRLFIKRALDVFVSLVTLSLLMPILIVLALVGAIVFRGNPFFIQERPGKDEQIFKIIKFRTMTSARSADGELLPDGERLPAYGRFLRAASLDELPEFINILKGDMSLVGPRPLLVKYLPLYTERQRLRHSIRPGLTGLAQISGRNAMTWEQKFEHDVRYVEEYSFSLDIRIIFKTVIAVFSASGINQEGCATAEEYRGTASYEENFDFKLKTLNEADRETEVV